MVSFVAVVGALHRYHVAVAIVGVLESLLKVAHERILAGLLGHIAVLIVLGGDFTALFVAVHDLIVAHTFVEYGIICAFLADGFDIQIIGSHGIEVAGDGLNAVVVGDDLGNGLLMGIVVGIDSGMIQILLAVAHDIHFFTHLPASIIIGILVLEYSVAALILALGHIAVLVEFLRVQTVLRTVHIVNDLHGIAVLIKFLNGDGVHIVCLVDFSLENLIAILVILVDGDDTILIIGAVIQGFGAQQQILCGGCISARSLRSDLFLHSFLGDGTAFDSSRAHLRRSIRLLLAAASKHHSSNGCNSNSGGQFFVSHSFFSFF